MRLSVRGLALTIGCTAFAVVLVVAGPRLWLRTAHGHRTVERVLTHILNERVPGRVSVGQLSGDVLGGLRANDVIVTNPAGAVIGRAQYIAARWQPVALLRRRELEEVQVERPVLALERARWLTSASARKAGPSREVRIKQIFAREGQVTWKRAVLTRVSGAATLYSLSHLDVHGVSGRVAGNVLHAFGVVGWGREPAWVATRFAIARPGRLHALGQLFYTPGQIEGEIEQAEIAAPVATRLVGGRGPLRLHGRVAGDLESLLGDVEAQKDERSLQLRIAIDRARRQATIAARLAGAPRPIRLHARARYRPGTIVLSALHANLGGSRLDAKGRLEPQRLRLDLQLRLRPAEAQLVGLRTAAPIVARLRADGRARALAVRGRAQLEAAQLAWRGRVDLPSRSGALRLSARALQPARLLRGPPAMSISGNAAIAGRLAPHAFVGNVRFERGSVDLPGYRLTDVTADSREVSLGRDGAVRVRQLSGRWRNHRFDARGRLSWSRRRIAVSGALLDFGGAHAQVDAVYQLADRRLTLRAAPLSLSRELVSRLLRRPFPRPWMSASYQSANIAGTNV